MSMASSRRAQVLIVLALAGVVVLAAWYGGEVRQDSGSFAVVLFGVPLACAALALWAEGASRTQLAPALVAVLGVASLAWSLLTAGGIGFGFVPSSLLLLVAATVSWFDRQERGTATSLRP
jgi:hypothetical protein